MCASTWTVGGEWLLRYLLVYLPPYPFLAFQRITTASGLCISTELTLSPVADGTCSVSPPAPVCAATTYRKGEHEKGSHASPLRTGPLVLKVGAFVMEREVRQPHHH